jgi:hypothetical protein|nr:MAG TPA: hypothetical protein [Caudoviricetes sp.]
MDSLREANSYGFDDMVDMAKGLSNVATQRYQNTSGNNSYSYSSIARAASKLIAVFPVLTSRTVSMSSAHAVSKYIEQISCQFFMLALQQANISNVKNGIDYLRNFHQNLDLGDDNSNAIIATMQSWLDAYERGTFENATIAGSMNAEAFAEASVDPFMFQADNVKISSTDIRDLVNLMHENANIEVLDTNLNPVSVNDYIVREFANGTYKVTMGYMDLNEAKKYTGKVKNNYNNGNNQNSGNSNQNNNQTQQKDYSGYIAARNKASDYDDQKASAREEKRHNNQTAEEKQRHDNKEAEQNNQFKNQKELESIKRKAEEEKAAKERADSQYNTQRAQQFRYGSAMILKDQDIKKMNDAVPSILVVRFYQRDNNGGISDIPTEFLIGVKSKIVPITTTEILRRIMNDNKDGQKFLKFMRTITGELKASEVILGLSRITDDVKSYKVKGARGDLWTLLQNRAAAAKSQIKSGKHNDFSAITTVLISQEDVDELYREENLDISDPKNALRFMSSYNLMGFAIVDDSNEVLHLLLDNGSKSFEDISYTMLERETQDGGTYKKLINLMASSR